MPGAIADIIADYERTIRTLTGALKVARQLLNDSDIDEDGPTPETIQIDKAIEDGENMS